MHLENSFFEEILHKVPAEIIVADAEFRYLFVNPSAVPDPDLRAWMIGKTNEEFCQHAGRPSVIARARRMVFGKAIRTRRMVEWTEERRDAKGVLQYYMHKVYPALDEEGRVQMVISYVVKITEQKEFEEKIRHSEKRYKDLFNHSQALICTHNMTGKLLDINPEVCRVLGYKEEEMLGRNIQEFMSAENRQKFDNEYLQAIRGGQSALSGVFCVLNKTGREIYLLYKNYRREEPGMEPYVIGFSQDITDRILMERELRFAKQLTDDASKAKESFLAHMSHEIRTPMNGILGIASLLNKTRLEPQQRNYLQLIQESANNLLVIVNDILDLEKIVAGKLQLEKISFKIVDKIATIIQSFIYRAEEQELGLIFQNSIPADLVVEGDPYRLSQVLNNILGNALKFTNEGHITISTRITERNDEWVVAEITISDTGIGIDKQHLRTIFEPFEQADAATSRKYGGTGLGLAICKNMIEMQKGELLVQSEEGKGSAFTIRIPYHLSIEAMQDNEVNQEIDYKSLGRKKVLVAEDVELNQYLARHILESWDFEVVVVNNGKEALEAMKHSSFDCILMDVQMPEMDGIEATRRIRKLPDPVQANVLIIALTANALKGDSEKYLAAGMNDYLAKPFDEERLFRVISRNLAKYRSPAGSSVAALNGTVSRGAAAGASTAAAAATTAPAAAPGATPTEAAISATPTSGATSAAPTTGSTPVISMAPIASGASTAPAAPGADPETEQTLKNNSSMSPVNSRLYDLSMVQSVSGGDEGFIKKMVALFIETVPQNVNDLKRALQEENWDQVGKTAHKLKSTIDSMGIKSIRQQIRDVEANAKAKTSLEQIPALIETIDTVIEECVEQLKAEVLN